MKKLVTLLILLLLTGCAEVDKNLEVQTTGRFPNTAFITAVIPLNTQYVVTTHPGLIRIYKPNKDNGKDIISSKNFPDFINKAVKVSDNEMIILSGKNLYRQKITELRQQGPLNPIKIKKKDRIDILSIVNADGYIYVLSRHGEMYRVNFETNQLDQLPDFRIYSPVKMEVFGDIFIVDKKDTLYRYKVDSQGDLKKVGSYSITTGIDEFIVQENTLVTIHGENIWFVDLSKKDKKMSEMYRIGHSRNLFLYNDQLVFNVDKSTKMASVESGFKQEFNPEIISESTVKYLYELDDQLFVAYENEGIAVYKKSTLGTSCMKPLSGSAIPRWLGKYKDQILVDTGEEFVREVYPHMGEFYPAMEDLQASQIKDDKIVFKKGMNYIEVKDLDNQFQEHYLLQFGDSSKKITSRVGISDKDIVIGTNDVYKANKLTLFSSIEEDKTYKQSDTFRMGDNPEDITYDIIMDGKTVFVTTLKSFIIFRIKDNKLKMITEYVYPPNFFASRLCYNKDNNIIAVSSENKTEYLLFKVQEDLVIDLLKHRKFKSGKNSLIQTFNGKYLISAIHFDKIILEDVSKPDHPDVVGEIPMPIFAKEIEMMGDRIFVNHLNAIEVIRIIGME